MLAVKVRAKTSPSFPQTRRFCLHNALISPCVFKGKNNSFSVVVFVNSSPIDRLPISHWENSKQFRKNMKNSCEKMLHTHCESPSFSMFACFPVSYSYKFRFALIFVKTFATFREENEAELRKKGSKYGWQLFAVMVCFCCNSRWLFLHLVLKMQLLKRKSKYLLQSSSKAALFHVSRAQADGDVWGLAGIVLMETASDNSSGD